MNDNELDVMLREHGAAWRNDNSHRPAIDWDAVMDSKRSPKIWIGLAAVVATAAAVVVPLAVVSSSKSTAKPTPVHQPLSLKVAEQGAPPDFWAVAGPDISGHGGATAYAINATSYSATQRDGDRGVALGVGSQPDLSYSGYQGKGCRSYLERNVEDPHHSSTLDAGTIKGRLQPSAIAISPDGTKLAFAVDGAGPKCTAVSRLEVYNLKTKTSKSWDVSTSREFQNLTWAPDGQSLVYQLDEQCLAASGECRPHQLPFTGTYSFDPATDASLSAARRLSQQLVDTGQDNVPAPDFYWHGQLVVLYNGAIRPVSIKGLGAPLATGFPKETISVSVDPTGDHMIMAAAPISAYGIGGKAYSTGTPYSTDNAIVTTTAYRWDRGLLTKVGGNWLLPAW